MAAKKKNPENGDLKKGVQDAMKVMKTSKKDHKTVMDIANEIIKRGRTDKKAAHQDINKVPTALTKENARKARKGKMIKEEGEIEDLDSEEIDLDAEMDIDPEVDPDVDPELDASPDMDIDAEAQLEGDNVPEPKFDIENDMSDYETPEDVEQSDDIDDIISNLLQSENIEIDVDAEKGTVKVTDTAKGDEKGVDKVKGDIELVADDAEKGPEGDISEDFVDDNLDLELENDLEESMEEEKVVKDQLEEMLSKFSKTYPKIFNESFTNKLGLIVEMYTKAKAKTIATQNIGKVVKSVDLYMEGIEKKFKNENKKALDEAIDTRKKEQLLASVKNLIESKLGKVQTNVGSKKVELALKMLYVENKKISTTNGKLKASLFNMKTNFIFETKTKTFSTKERVAISKLLEDYDFKTTKDFQMKLESAIDIVRSIDKKNKKSKINESRIQKTRSINKPIKRTDGTLTLEKVRKAIRKRKAEKINENVDKNNDNDVEEVDMEQFEKHIS